MSTEPESLPTPGEPTLAALCDTVREALAKASKGPWRTEREVYGNDAYSDRVLGPGDAGDPLAHESLVATHFEQITQCDAEFRDRRTAANAALIASAPTWLARLVEGVREMEALLQRWMIAAMMVKLPGGPIEGFDRNNPERWRDTQATLALALLDRATALQAKLADAERWRDVHELLAGARLQYSVGGIDGARSVLKQMFDAYDTAVSAWEECDICDGCGWYEGGVALRSHCYTCGGTGKVRVYPAAVRAAGDHEGIDMTPIYLLAKEGYDEFTVLGAYLDKDLAERERVRLEAAANKHRDHFSRRHKEEIKLSLYEYEADKTLVEIVVRIREDGEVTEMNVRLGTVYNSTQREEEWWGTGVTEEDALRMAQEKRRATRSGA